LRRTGRLLHSWEHKRREFIGNRRTITEREPFQITQIHFSISTTDGLMKIAEQIVTTGDASLPKKFSELK
jgi:hypothetical protein